MTRDVVDEESLPARRGRGWTWNDVNLVLDAVLLVVFMALCFAAVVVRFVFPPGPGAKGWTLWGFDYDAWGGVQFGLAKLDLSTYAVVTACVALLYKVLWALSGGDTPGMAAVQLRLINFDGNRPSREERLLRVLVSIVSFASLGVGLLWCLFDEEKLTWHDHITKTFSSPKVED